MGRLTVLMTTATAIAAATGEVLIDTSFSTSPEAAHYRLDSARNPRVRGVLPKGWEDDSAWAQTWITYGFEDEQGTRFLRMDVKRIEDGRPQLICFPLPDANAEMLYRLSLRCRNQTGGDVTFGLRQRGTPYRFYWQRTEKLSADWRTSTYEFRVGGNDQPMGLWFNLSAPGMFDLGDVKLERLSDPDLVREIQGRYPDGGPANLFRNTRFPLGLQNGWALDRDSSDGDVAVAEAATGADFPALRLASAEPTTLRSEPFAAVYPVTEHVVAISLKGSGDWHVTVVHDGRTYGSATVTARDDWQRVRVPFKPVMGVPFYQVRIAGSGDLLIDRLQAAPTAKCAEYATAYPCEVALALPASYEAAEARVVFGDEGPIRIAGRVTGISPGVTVRTTVANVYGDETALAPVQPTGDGTVSLNIGPVASTPWGSFRVESWCEKGGERVSPVNELVVHRVHRPRYWDRDAPFSPFGVHTNSTVRHLVMAKAIGLNWTRLHDAGLQYFGWWNLEPQKGSWRFFDREIARYRTHHIRIFAELGTAPAWASYYGDTGRTQFGYFDKFFQPKSLDDYANYVRTVCERYKDQIDAFDVWNEPWIHAWWGVAYDSGKGDRAGYITSKEPQRDFARMMKVARDTARSIIPEAMVMGFNTTTGATTGARNFSGSDWTRGVLEAGGLDDCDGIAYHAYTGGGVGFPGDTVEEGLAVAVGPIREALGEVPKPIWMTEGSPLIHRMSNGLYRHTVPGVPPEDVVEDADRMARYLVSMLANGVGRIFLYSMHAQGDFRTDPKQWNVFTTDEGYLHPSGTAHAYCAWLLEDTRFVRRVDLSGGIHVYVFSGAGHAVAAVSSGTVWEPVPLPPADDAVARTDLFGNDLAQDSVFNGRLLYYSADGQGAAARLIRLFGSTP